MFYEPKKNLTDAYHTDGTHKWFGRAPKGTLTSVASWQIMKMEYTGNNWIIKWPRDPVTLLGTDAPKFIWDNVETYTYQLLGC
jgi:hypothetical protein